MRKQPSRSIFTKLLWYSLLLIVALVPFKAHAESETVRADYQNVLIVPPGTNPPVDRTTSATFFGGHIGEYAVPGTGNFLSESSFGQAFARDIPYPGFDDAALETAIKMLYEGDDAAFRYKAFMYKKDGENFIKAQFEDIMDYWGNDQRDRALDAADEIRSALRYAPLNRNLRWALLDIYYDIAVADLALAREKMVKAFQASLGIGVVAPQGEFLISTEIELLEEALPLYQKAIEGYFRLINDPMGVNVVNIDPNVTDDVPFGYYIFMQEVPQRSLFSPLFKDTYDKWKLAPEDGKGDKILSGYKDLVLLFNVQRDYARAASQLARRYILRSAPAYGDEDSDYDKALKLIGDVQQTCYIEGNVVLGIFPDYADENNGADSDSGLLEAINSWRHELTELSHLKTYANGETNLLGFTDDFLVLVQSVIPGDPQTQYFDSYNYFAAYLNNAASGGPLYNALDYWNNAKTDYENYRDRSDKLAIQFRNKSEQYNERLRQIVGVNPGDAGYDTPFDNEGSEMYLQDLNIDIARKHIEANQQEIADLREQVEIEIWRRGKEHGINDAIQLVYLDYGEQQANLTHEIANINAAQAFANNIAAAIASTSVSVGIPPSVSISGGLVAYPVNAVLQAWGEYEKGMRQATKERLAGKEKAEVLAYNDELLDINSKAQIKTWMLRMNTLAIESAEAAIVLVQEIGRLTALINEKENLERRKAETNESLADRYFADPSHRLLKDESILRAELSFQRAQKWMFFTVRALEYKWNQKFEHYYQTTNRTYTLDTLLALRNAKELKDMFDAMAEWDVTRAISGLNDDWYVKFSFREDFLGYRNGSQYFDPVSGEPVQPWEAFQSYLGQESLRLSPRSVDSRNELEVKALRLTFSTVTAKETLGFFSRNNWLDKIKYMRVRVIGASSTGLHSILQGYLKYGGTSFIRNMERGVPDPERPDRYLNEMTCYSTRYWYWKNDVLGWQSKDALGASIALEVSSDPDVPPTVKEIDVFKERSVATSEWTLYLPLEDENHNPVIDTSEITDIEIHFYYYWYNRN